MKLESNLRNPSAMHHLAPVVDTLLILLIFFLLGSKLLVQSGLAVSLPPSGSKLTQFSDSRVLTVSAGEVPELFLDGDRVEFSDLAEALADNPGEATSLMLRIDTMVSFGMVMRVTNLALEYDYEIAYATAPAETSEP
jgi:biopolymer transport protein ExbD